MRRSSKVLANVLPKLANQCPRGKIALLLVLHSVPSPGRRIGRCFRQVSLSYVRFEECAHGLDTPIGIIALLLDVPAELALQIERALARWLFRPEDNCRITEDDFVARIPIEQHVERRRVCKRCLDADWGIEALRLAVGFERSCIEGNKRCTGRVCAAHSL
ncbi:MAG: hypothetical protein KatS3mg038_3719 [Candidatus Kapaibacterium sp.]|nr:MAG: hypothetical protein KatS3mg038_3719 [Candidatus Kapabacteria bacterium]